MSKPNPKGSSRKQPFLAALADSLATQNELIDSLTAHISLYHSHSSASPNPNSNPSPPRSSILKWFASLAVHQRQAHLTVVDHRFTQLLIQMLGKLRTNGHGRFIILPDLPSGDLPGLCYKKSRGLLCRSAESNDSERLIFESARLFWSREGEKIEECSCSAKCLDSVTVSEDFVENLDKFVETMDNVSNGAFLKGEVGELGSDWVELEWLKATGYYSIEAFVANRLEVALRLAWLNCCSGKKRGIKLKEKVAAPGVAANVFWRKKGCIDWWENLGAEMRRRILVVVLGKAAKSLTHEVLKGASSALEDERWLFRARGEQQWRDIYAGPLAKSGLSLLSDAEFGSIIMPASSSGIDAFVANVFNPLIVLQKFFPLIPPGQDREYNVSKIFFSSLGSINTISDCILRKLRGFFMVISLDCMKLELFGEGTSKPSNKPKNKLVAGSHRKKGKTHGMKKLASEPQTCVGMSSFENPPKDLECTLACHEIHTIGCHGMTEIPLAKDEHGALLSPTEHSKGLVLGKGRNAARRNRKGRSKNKISGKLAEERNFPMSVVEAPCFSVISSDEVAKQGGISDKLTGQNVSNDNVIDVVKHASNASLSSSGDEPTRNEISADHAVGSTEGLCHVVPAPELDDVSSNVDANIRTGKLEATAGSAHKSVGNLGINGESTRFQGQLNGNLYDSGSTSPLECLSYEWPVLAPFYFPSTNSHIPTATDRLHLDVGHNWHNHIRQPFVSSVLQARNSPIESSCNRMLPRPLPMSLDWPPMVRSVRGFTPSMTCNYDSRFISRRQSTFQKNFTAQNMQFNAKTIDDDRKNSGEFMDFPESMNGLELAEECDNNWMSEEELEVHTVPGIDYNQYFGGGVMYWNSSDYPGTGFSRPPSISSDDSSWAWREADMNRAVDDMVSFSSSYSTNGLTSPTAATFCSPFDPLGPGHQTLGYAVPGNEAPGKVLHSSSTVKDTVTEEVSVSLGSLPVDIEGKTGESLPYPILRPIIISKEVPRSDIKHNPHHKSPCVPPMRREQAQIKRPPSPVVLCVPRAPRPPPPSPASDTRKRRGFPTVRSGSSSPRNWGMRGWYQDGTNLEEACVRMDGTEVIWPSWRNKNLSACPMIQPLSGALLQDHLIAMSQLARDQEHPDVSFPLLPPELQSCPKRKPSISLMHSLLHDEIDLFYKKVAAANMAHKPFINWAVKRVTRSLQVLWPRSRTNIYGSNATGLSLPTSDVDLVVCLPPVRNLEPIKEAGILEGRNGIKETCLQHAARYLANQEWVKNDSLKTVENTAIPIIMLVVEVPNDLNIPASSNTQSPKEEAANITAEEDNNIQSDMAGLEDSVSPKFAQSDNDSTKDVKSVRLDISFKSASHTGLQTTELVKGLTEQFPAATPLALVLKQFLADRSLDQSYSGGLSSYCLVLLITRFLQHEHHLGRPINQNLGTLLMDFLYFFGNVFDPRQMRISVQGSGVYLKRERGYSIDPIHIDDPLFPTNNVGRNCFRIHQCIKAFSDAYSVLENELMCLPDEGDKCSRGSYSLLQKIIPNLGQGV